MATDNGKKRRIMIITADESLIEQIQNSTSSSLLKSFILDSDGDRVELTPSTTPSGSTEVSSSPPAKKSKAGTLTCVVCGSPANGYNFDAITCESCKAFFRRNALKDPVRRRRSASNLRSIDRSISRARWNAVVKVCATSIWIRVVAVRPVGCENVLGKE